MFVYFLSLSSTELITNENLNRNNKTDIKKLTDGSITPDFFLLSIISSVHILVSYGQRNIMATD